MTAWLGRLFLMAALPGCSVIASYPDVAPENSNTTCIDGVDNDLNGELDCAEETCRDHCPDRSAVEQVLLRPCPTDFAEQLIGTPGVVEACAPSRCDDDRWLLSEDGCACPVVPPGAIPVTPTSLPAVLAAAAPDAVLALAAGRYSGPIVLHQPGLQLRGDCAGETVFEAPESSAPVIRIDAGDVTLLDLVVRGAGGPGLVLSDGAGAELRGVAIEDVQGAGIDVGAARLVAGRAAISGVSGDGAVGLRVGPGADVTLTGVLIEAAAATAVSIDCGGEACFDADYLVVREGENEATGIDLRSGSIDLRHTTIEGPVGHGLLVAAGSAALEDVVISQVRPAGAEPGTGIEIRPGARLTARRLRLRHNLFRGMVIQGPDAEAILTDFELLGEQESGTDGVGVLLQGGRMVMMSFVVDAAGLCGMRLSGDVGFSGTEGLIANNSRGACVSSTSVTPGQLTSSITYDRNGRNIVVE